MSRVIEVVQSNIVMAEAGFNSSLVDKTLTWSAEMAFAMQILEGNDYLAKAAASHPQSLIHAMHNVAAIGLTLNPAKKYAHLIPRNCRMADGSYATVVCLDISYRGMCYLAVISGAVEWVQSRLVHAADSYTPAMRIGDQPDHKYNPFLSVDERGPIIGAYCVAKIKSGDYLVEEMSKQDLDRCKARSESVKKGKPSPWTTDEGEMYRKVPVRRAYKMWPVDCDRLHMAMNILDSADANDRHEKDVTIANDKQLEEIESILLSLNRTWDQFAAKDRTMPKSINDLTATQAESAICTLNNVMKNRVKKEQPVAQELNSESGDGNGKPE